MDSLTATLFPDDGANTYAIIDGASCEELLAKLDEFAPESVCLYAGEIEPDVAEVAPYLVLLHADHPFVQWLLSNGFGKHWGIFIRSPANLQAMRKHFRSFLLVRSPEGKSLYFRYYDPRVLRTYLPTCQPGETRLIFGPISEYLTENEDTSLTRWSQDGGKLVSAKIVLQA